MPLLMDNLIHSADTRLPQSAEVGFRLTLVLIFYCSTEGKFADMSWAHYCSKLEGNQHSAYLCYSVAISYPTNKQKHKDQNITLATTWPK